MPQTKNVYWIKYKTKHMTEVSLTCSSDVLVIKYCCLGPRARHQTWCISVKEVNKQNKMSDCKIKAHASNLIFLFLGEYFFAASQVVCLFAAKHASRTSSLQPAHLSGGGWGARWKPQVVTKLWFLTGNPQNLRWVRTQIHRHRHLLGVTDFRHIAMDSRPLNGPEGQSFWICSPSASNPINLRAGLFSGETLSSHLNIYGQPGALCQQTLPNSSRLPSPFIRSSPFHPLPLLLSVTLWFIVFHRRFFRDLCSSLWLQWYWLQRGSSVGEDAVARSSETFLSVLNVPHGRKPP